MVIEASLARTAISQWAAIISVTLATAGLLIGVVGFIEKEVSKLDAIESRILRIEQTAESNEIRLRADHDELIKLQTELRLHMRGYNEPGSPR
jgi:hypothetical protein